jgi:hypothetical protein
MNIPGVIQPDHDLTLRVFITGIRILGKRHIIGNVCPPRPGKGQIETPGGAQASNGDQPDRQAGTIDLPTPVPAPHDGSIRFYGIGRTRPVPACSQGKVCPSAG